MLLISIFCTFHAYFSDILKVVGSWDGQDLQLFRFILNSVLDPPIRVSAQFEFCNVFVAFFTEFLFCWRVMEFFVVVEINPFHSSERFDDIFSKPLAIIIPF